MDQDAQTLDAEDLMAFFERIDRLPPEDAAWVSRLFDECARARAHEAELMEGVGNNEGNGVSAGNGGASSSGSASDAQLAQVALDTTEWLRTLWNVGYMGAGSLPARPRTEFPVIEMEDVIKSSLFARIREGKRPLPFPPPTRNGLPWHDLIEGPPESNVVNAEMVSDENGVTIAAIIEGCADWVVIEDAGDKTGYVVQYRGKGPLFKLDINPFFSTLQRKPPQWERWIRMQERAGICSYILIWPSEVGGPAREVPLPATSWERAESEAAYWVAKNRPEMYGQIRFELQAPPG